MLVNIILAVCVACCSASRTVPVPEVIARRSIMQRLAQEDISARMREYLGTAEDDKPSSPNRKTAPAVIQVAADFNHPPREYAVRKLRGWDVLVEKQLLDDAPELAKKALGKLDEKLGKAVEVLPEAVLPDLRRLKIFLMYGPKAKGGGRGNGLEYFRPDAAKHQSWLDPRMARSVVIYDASNYISIGDFWELKALVHEFGHAHHLEHWPEDREDIYDTWDHAMKAGLYKTVRDEDKSTHLPNYAAQNHLEYFAELSAAYFVGINYFPKDRAGLKEYDPDGYALIEKLWGISGKVPAATVDWSKLTSESKR